MRIDVQLRNKIPGQVLDALERLQHAGYPAYLVGGCVRDLLRGETPHDFDITTAALPEETKAVFSDLHVAETGIKHGTVTVLLDKYPLEITTFRTDGTYSDGRHPDTVRFTRTLEEDLRRRDFTVNAMALSPASGLVDPFRGRDDLTEGIIRCVGDPEARFREDTLRILRGTRFASCLDFKIEPSTADTIHRLTPLLKNVSIERISAEFVRLLCGTGVERVLTHFRELIAFFVPEIRPTFDFDQKTPHHCFDVYTHTVKVVAATPPEPVLRLAAFFHDIGKPAAFTCKNGKGHFHGHPGISAMIAETVMHRLHMERKLIRDVVLLVKEHDCLLKKTENGALRLLQRMPNKLLDPLLFLMRADASAKTAPAPSLARVEKLGAELSEILRNAPCLTVKDLAIGGKELLELGIPEGKQIGEMLDTLLNLVIDGVLQNSKEAIVHYVLKTVDNP